LASKGFYGLSAFGLILIVFIANSLGGTPYYLDKAHPTCWDGIDNDNFDAFNPKADVLDDDCLYMPYDFGVGEGANPDGPFGTGPLMHPDPAYQNYAEAWNSTGNAYPTLYEYLTVHIYDNAPCGDASLDLTKVQRPVEDVLSVWVTYYDMSDTKTGWDDYLDTCQ
jgi:hypothetical protein